MADRLGELTAAGVAIWLDDLSRARLATGSLAGLVDDSHVVGVTTNPTIFAEGDQRQRPLRPRRSATSPPAASGSTKPCA